MGGLLFSGGERRRNGSGGRREVVGHWRKWREGNDRLYCMRELRKKEGEREKKEVK